MRAVGGILTTQQKPIMILGVTPLLGCISLIFPLVTMFVFFLFGAGNWGMLLGFGGYGIIFMGLRTLCAKTPHIENIIFNAWLKWGFKKQITIKPGKAPLPPKKKQNRADLSVGEN